MVLAVSQTAIGGVILFASIVIAIGYAFINLRSGRAEIASEIELAPNRKAHYDDEELEGPQLTRKLTFGVIGIFVVAIALPLYWLNESPREDGAVEDFKRKFVDRGGEMFDTTANGGFNCAFCHGGMKATGGTAEFTVTDANGAFVKQVTWQAPALNTVLLRYSREEVRYVLTYGRPGTPMPPWGLKGGGPMNDQQLQNLIDYLESIQISKEESQKQVTDKLAEMRAKVDESGARVYPDSITDGELLFNLGYDDNFAGGAYACGRCHTTGWSYDDKTADGTGALGPSLRAGASLARFPGANGLGLEQQVDFVCSGSENGRGYGRNGQGSGRMPGFCQTPEETADPAALEVGVVKQDPSDPDTEGGMLTKEQVQAIVEYERGL